MGRRGRSERSEGLLQSREWEFYEERAKSSNNVLMEKVAYLIITMCAQSHGPALHAGGDSDSVGMTQSSMKVLGCFSGV
ncbi:unnamed protein product [Allacma fusca]|uniref:Uncharacterized protein n=1 Tax=Allacma fusca TaxID=39272 RepID=A0A8J2KA13_9HEXA|nr:unnamed protein product [Allacma fusca]